MKGKGTMQRMGWRERKGRGERAGKGKGKKGKRMEAYGFPTSGLWLRLMRVAHIIRNILCLTNCILLTAVSTAIVLFFFQIHGRAVAHISRSVYAFVFSQHFM